MTTIPIIEQSDEIRTLIERQSNNLVAVEHYRNFKAAVERSTCGEPDRISWDAPRSSAVGARFVKCLSKFSQHMRHTLAPILLGAGHAGVSWVGWMRGGFQALFNV